MTRSFTPITKRISVPLPPEQAFRLFTSDMTSWWPLESHSVFQGDASRVEFPEQAGRPITEYASDGRSAVWGTVIEVDPPSGVRFTWHPGRGPETAQEVEVTFTADGDGTRVELTHTGWDVLGEKAEETRSGYDSGWGLVLGRYTG